MNNTIANTTITIVFFALFIVGVGLGIGYSSYTIIPMFTILPLIACFFYKGNYRNLIIISSIAFVIGFYYSIARFPHIDINDISKIAPQNNIIMIGEVVSEPRVKSDNKLSFDFKVQKAIINNETKIYSGTTLVTIYDKYSANNAITIGNLLKIKGNIYLPNASTNPYQFDYKKYLKYQGIASSFYVTWKDYQILSPPKSFKYKALNYLNLIKKHIEIIHFKALNKEEAQLLGGIILGDRAIPMDKELKQHFINSGLAHILAASGINVALLALAWIFVTSRLGLPYNIQIIGGMIIVIFYSILTGLPPSVLRASIMLEFLLIGKLINKDADMVSIIFFVAGILLLFNPYMITDIGFQLSFMTALGLIISVPIFQKYITTLHQGLAMLVLIPFIAQLWAMPIIMFHFNNFSTYSIVANFFAMPLVAIITYGGFVSSVVSIIPIIGIKIAIFIDHLLGPVLWLLLSLAKYISSLPLSLEHFSLNSIYIVLIFYLLILFILYAMWKEYKSQHYIIFISCIMVLFLGFKILVPTNNSLKITFFDVGDADSILIKTPKNKNILIDGGYRGRNNFNSADWVLKPYFYKKNINTIDAVILTHPENDHIGGLPEILEEFNVNDYFDNGSYSKNKSYNRLLKNMVTKKINYSIAREGDIIVEDNIRLEILNPKDKLPPKNTLNQNSILIKLSYLDFSILLTGDTEKEILKTIKNNNLNVNVLKVGHHGSKISIDQDYINKTKPEIAIISAGKKKIHPAENILDLLKKNNITTYITKEKGAITITSDGTGYDVSTHINKF